MVRNLRRTVLPVVLAGAVAVGLAVPAFAVTKAQGSIAIAPHHVKVGGSATLTGKGLVPNKYFALILIVPTHTGPYEQFITTKPVPRSNAKGRFTVKFRLPKIPICGKAEIDAYVTRTVKVLKAPLVLTGCKTPKKGSSPPPPPPHP